MGGGRREVGVLQNIMRALCAVIQLDHFEFASYGPALHGYLHVAVGYISDVAVTGFHCICIAQFAFLKLIIL